MMKKEINLSYYPDINQFQSAKSIDEAVQVFASFLSAEYSRRTGEDVKFNVMPVKDVKTQTIMMQNNTEDCGVALMKPVSYVLANLKNNNIYPAGVALRIIEDVETEYYLGQLFANKNSGITKISDINKKHRMAYGDSFSTSNFLLPALELYKNGVHPFTSFRMSKFFGGHDGSAKAVYYNDADIGAGHDGAIALLANQKGFEDASKVLHQIHKVNIYSDPVVINKNFIVDVDNFTNSLIEISKNEVVKKALRDFWGNVSRIDKADPQKYAPIEEALTILNLLDRDLL